MKINVTKSSLPTLDEYCNEIKDIWETCWLTNNGQKHNELEQKLKVYLECDNVTLFVNGHLALEALISSYCFPKESEIITTPFTFVSTTNAIIRNGLIPVFCDINSDDYTIDVTKIEKLITKKTVAILPVHVYGNICQVEELEAIAKKHNLKLIYDAAHAFGTKYKNRPISQFGDALMFSFHATKVFNTIEGGCVVVNTEKKPICHFLNSFKNFGIVNEEQCEYNGFNAKMNEFQACMGLCNLRHIDSYIFNRSLVYNRYIKNLGNVDGIRLSLIQRNVQSNYSYFSILCDGIKFSRDKIKEKLKNHGIMTRKYFFPLTSEFDSCKRFNKNDTPIAKMVSENVLTLPMYSDLTIDEVDRICSIILEDD